MDKLIKSVIYLTGFSSLGYILLVACTPNEEQIKQIRKTLPGTNTENIRKRELFAQVLQQAAEEKPIYLRTKPDDK